MDNRDIDFGPPPQMPDLPEVPSAPEMPSLPQAPPPLENFPPPPPPSGYPPQQGGFEQRPPDSQGSSQGFPPPPQGFPPQQGGFQPQPGGFTPQHPPGTYPGKGISVASLVLGICSFFFGGFVTAIIGLILGVNGKKKAAAVGAPTGIAQAGIITSIIALVVYVLVTIACVVCLAYIPEAQYLFDVL